MSNSDSDTPTPSSMDADYEKPMLNSFSIIQFARNKIQKTKTTKFSIYEFSLALFGRLLSDQTFIFTKCFTLKYSNETTKHSHQQVDIAFFWFRFVSCDVVTTRIRLFLLHCIALILLQNKTLATRMASSQLAILLITRTLSSSNHGLTNTFNPESLKQI